MCFYKYNTLYKNCYFDLSDVLKTSIMLHSASATVMYLNRVQSRISHGENLDNKHIYPLFFTLGSNLIFFASTLLSRAHLCIVMCSPSVYVPVFYPKRFCCLGSFSNSAHASLSSIKISLDRFSLSVPMCLSGWTDRHALRYIFLTFVGPTS